MNEILQFISLQMNEILQFISLQMNEILKVELQFVSSQCALDILKHVTLQILSQ